MNFSIGAVFSKLKDYNNAIYFFKLALECEKMNN